MDKILEITLLYDFYGELLTDKQKQIFEMYHLNDLSLGEIGEQLKISRQAVRDSLKHSENSLKEYENKLELISKFICNKAYIEQIQQIINSLKQSALSEQSIKCLEQIDKLILKIVE